MSKFEILYDEMPEVKSRLQDTGGNLADIAGRLRRQVGYLNGQRGFGIEQISSAINQEAAVVNTRSKDAYAIATFINEVYSSVVEAENAAYTLLAGAAPEAVQYAEANVSFEQLVGNGVTPVKDSVIADWFSSVKDYAVSILNNLGFVGPVIGNLISATTAKNWGERLALLGKAGVSVYKMIQEIKNIKKIARVFKATPEKVKAMWANRLLGTKESLKYYSVAKDPMKRFSYGFKKAFEKKVGAFSGAKSTATWANIVFSGVLNYFDNKEEMERGEITRERAIAETITETAIDVGKGILIGAGAVAVLGATVGSAPVWAVAVVSTGVVMGLDAVSKAFTGKGATETVSDFVLDASEAVGEATQKVVQDTMNAAANCYNNVTNAFAGWGKALGFN